MPHHAKGRCVCLDVFLTKWLYDIHTEKFFTQSFVWILVWLQCFCCKMKHASSCLTLFSVSASRSAVYDREHMGLSVSSQCLQWPLWFGYGQMG